MRIARTRLVLGLIAVVFACASPGYATTFIMMSESDLAARSVAAVSGRVDDIEAVADPATSGVNTYVHIEPERVVFGALPAGTIVLRETGGRLRDQTEWIDGSPEYRVGEDVLVFLSQNADGTLRTTALAMGKFTIERDARGALTAVRELGEGAAVWDPERGALTTDPGPESYDFERLVEDARLAKPAAAVGAFSRRLPVELVPPELARAAVREHQESFTYLSSPSRWFEPDDGLPVSYLIDGTGDVGLGPTTSRAAINDAFAAWTNVSTASIVLADGGTLPAPVTFAGCDGGNRIMFNDPFNEVTDPTSCGGVLAVGGFCSSSETRTVNGTSFRRIRVGKITFNNGWSSCSGWNRCNLSEVATHELGHTIGFGHSTDFNATMYAAAHFDSRCASLRTDDLAAVNFVYPNVGTPAATGTATPVPPTATFTPTRTPVPPTATFTPTWTPVPPTATFTPTRTSAPPTATNTRTATAVPPTATRTSTPIVPTSTATRTVPPTLTWTATQPPAPTDTATAIPPTGTPTSGIARHKVRGHVMYSSTTRGVPSVTVNLSGATQDATQTSDAGDYAFDSVTDGTWELAAQKDTDNTAMAVSALDAAYVLQAVVQLRTFDDAQRLACDTTGDGQLSALDATRILQFSVGTLDRLPVAERCGTDWTFSPDPAPAPLQSLIEPIIASGICTDGKIMLEDLLADAQDQNFHAVLFGDCTGNWNPSPAGALERPGKDAPRVRLAHPATHGKRVRLPVYVRAAAPYQALDLQIGYDAARLTPVTVAMPRSGDDAISSFHVAEPGTLRVAVASGRPIAGRFVLTVEFTLADGVSDPGRVRALAAHVDEAVAKLSGSASR